MTGPLINLKETAPAELSLATNTNEASVTNLFGIGGKSIPFAYKVPFAKLLSTVTSNFVNLPLLLTMSVSVPGLTAVITPSDEILNMVVYYGEETVEISLLKAPALRKATVYLASAFFNKKPDDFACYNTMNSKMINCFPATK